MSDTSRGGFSLVEVVVVMFLVSVVVLGVARFLEASMRATRVSSDRATAQVIARNHLEGLRSLGPSAADAAVGQWQVGADGVIDPAGKFTLEVAREIRCEGGGLTGDPAEAASVIPHACEQARPVLEYSVTVEYPTPAASGPADPTVSYSLILGGSTPYRAEGGA